MIFVVMKLVNEISNRLRKNPRSLIVPLCPYGEDPPFARHVRPIERPLNTRLTGAPEGGERRARIAYDPSMPPSARPDRAAAPARYRRQLLRRADDPIRRSVFDYRFPLQLSGRGTGRAVPPAVLL